LVFFSFTSPPPTAIYTLSLHDALPISSVRAARSTPCCAHFRCADYQTSQRGLRTIGESSLQENACWNSRRFEIGPITRYLAIGRSEEHTSELQSRSDLVCRLLLEKKKK